MKKLLSFLGSLVITASPLTSVVSCREQTNIINWSDIKESIINKIQNQEIKKYSVLKDTLCNSDDFFNDIKGIDGIDGNTAEEKNNNVKIEINENNFSNNYGMEEYKIHIKLKVNEKYKIEGEKNEYGFYDFKVNLYKFIPMFFIQNKLNESIQGDKNFHNENEVIEALVKATNNFEGIELVKAQKENNNENNLYSVTLKSKDEVEIENENENKEQIFKVEQLTKFLILDKRIKAYLEDNINKINNFEEAKNKINELNNNPNNVVKGLKSIKFKDVDPLEKNIFKFNIELECDETHIFENKKANTTLKIDTAVTSKLLNKWFKFRVNIGIKYSYTWEIPYLNKVPGAKINFNYDDKETDPEKFYKFEKIDENKIKITGLQKGEKSLVVNYGNGPKLIIKVNLTQATVMHDFDLVNSKDYETIHQFNKINDEIYLDLNTNFDSKQISVLTESIKDNFLVNIDKNNNKSLLRIKYIKAIENSNDKNNILSLFPDGARNGINVKINVN